MYIHKVGYMVNNHNRGVLFNIFIKWYTVLQQNGRHKWELDNNGKENGNKEFNSPSIVKSRGNWFYLAK